MSEILFRPLIFKLMGYSLALVGGDFLYRCTFELFEEYKNITLGKMKMFPTIWSLLRQKCTSNFLQFVYIVSIASGMVALPKFHEAVMQSDFWMVLMLTPLIKGFNSQCIYNTRHKLKQIYLSKLYQFAMHKYGQSGDAYKHFIYNSGLDCGSFMAYSFYHGYIQYVVASSSDISSKGLEERIKDYEATEKVFFPLKKLLILQPKSLYIPPKLESNHLEIAKNLEEVKINRGGVANRSYQLSVYKIKGFEGQDWYVNVQGASPLLTYHEECQRSKLLDHYKNDVSLSFLKHLQYLIKNDSRCRGLVDVIYYDDLNEKGEPVDVGLVLKKYIEESLTN